MRYWIGLLMLLLILLISPAGCGPALSETDLGTVTFEMPKVPGADAPYRMPQLEAPAQHDKDQGTQHVI
jgi:hypothetical protein